MSKRQGIVNTVVAGFKTIKIANGYNYDLDQKIHQFQKAEIRKADLPVVNIEDREDETENFADDGTKLITINFYVSAKASSAKLTSAKLTLLLEDMVKMWHTLKDLNSDIYSWDYLGSRKDIEHEKEIIGEIEADFTIGYLAPPGTI